MAKIIIAGGAWILQSNFTLEELKLIERFRPNALTLKDEQGNPTFKVSTGRHPDVSKFGATFNGVSADGTGMACITSGIPDGTEDVRQYVSDIVGTAIINLNKIEEHIPQVLEEIAAEQEAIRSSITVV